MRRLNLTTEDMDDLNAGRTINAMIEDGEEVATSADRPTAPVLDGPTRPVALSGTLTMSNGKHVSFALQPDGTFMQWGADTETLGANVDLLEALAAAAYDHLSEED